LARERVEIATTVLLLFALDKPGEEEEKRGSEECMVELKSKKEWLMSNNQLKSEEFCHVA
jgi:hypothetical protein